VSIRLAGRTFSAACHRLLVLGLIRLVQTRDEALGSHNLTIKVGECGLRVGLLFREADTGKDLELGSGSAAHHNTQFVSCENDQKRGRQSSNQYYSGLQSSWPP